MPKTISQRISDSFENDESTTNAKEYSEKVYAAWKDMSTALSRTATLIVLFMAIFELLAYQRGSGAISIGSFTLFNAPVVQIVLPAAVAFLYYDGYRLSVRWAQLQEAYQVLMRKIYKRQSENGLDVLIKPPTPLFWGIGALISRDIKQDPENFLDQMNIITFVLAAVILPIVFECQAYFRLFQKFGYHVPILWACLLISAILIFCIFWFTHLGVKSDI